MGAVYKGVHIDLDRPVAIKVLHAQLGADAAFLKRFQREARAMARMDHPSIMRVFDVAEDCGSHYIVMEYFPGKDLKHFLTEQGRFNPSEMVSVATHITSALAYAHAHGVIHRDIKSANIMIHDDGRVKVTDFGIAAATDEASVTMTGQIMGTPEYMSPEQAHGESVDARTDLYSLGVLMYEMLNGKTQFHGLSRMSILAKLVQEKEEWNLLFPADIPDSLQRLIATLVRKNPNDRIYDAKDVMEQMKKIAADMEQRKPTMPMLHKEEEIGETVAIQDIRKTLRPKVAQQPKTVHPVPVRRTPLVPWISSILGILIIGSGFFYYRSQSQDTTPSPEATLPPALPQTTLIPSDKTPTLFNEINRKKDEIGTIQERLAQSRQGANAANAQDSETYKEAIAFSDKGQEALQWAENGISNNQMGEAKTALEDAEDHLSRAADLFDQARETAMAQQTEKQDDFLLREIEKRRGEIGIVQNQLAQSQKDADKANAQGTKAYQEALTFSGYGRKALQSAEKWIRKKQIEKAKTALEDARGNFRQAMNRFDDARLQIIRQAEEERTARTKQEEEKTLRDEIEKKQAVLRDLQVQAAHARKKAEEEGVHEQEAYKEAVAWADKGSQRVQSGMGFVASHQFMEAKTVLDEALGHYNQAIRRFDTAREAEQSQRGNDEQRVKEMLDRFKIAYERRDLSTLKQITVMSKAKIAFLEQIFSHYSITNISLSTPSVNSQSASATMTITKLVDKEGNLAIPGEQWKESRLTISKKGGQWGLISW